MEPVGNLDKDDSDVLGHGHKHLAQVFHLLVFLGRVYDSGQLGYAFDNISYGLSEQLRNLLVSRDSVFNAIVKKTGDNRIFVEAHFRCNLGSGYRMSYKRRTVFSGLAFVRALRKIKRRSEPFPVERRIIGKDSLFEILINSASVIHIITSLSINANM
jgi:hypothetical protein